MAGKNREKMSWIAEAKVKEYIEMVKRIQESQEFSVYEKALIVDALNSEMEFWRSWSKED
jgi:hypothetical protein